MNLDVKNKENPDKRHLIKFLLRAKKATYAGSGEETESSRIASHDLKYKERELYYYILILVENV